MSLIKPTLVKKYVKPYGKRMSKEALRVLDERVISLVVNACSLLPKHVKTIKATEMQHAKG